MKPLVSMADVESYDATRLEKARHSAKRSVNAVHDTFDLIGGVPRLALWAAANPSDFYTKIWNRTVQMSQAIEHSGEIIVRTAIPRTALDGEYEDVTECQTSSSTTSPEQSSFPSTSDTNDTPASSPIAASEKQSQA